MLKILLVTFLGVFAASAQDNRPVKHPQIVNPGYLSQLGATTKYASANKLTPDGNAATKQQRVDSVQNFSASFTFQGTVFPYTMVGRDPQKGDTTRVETSLITIQFFFDEFVDQNGNNIVLDGGKAIGAVTVAIAAGKK